jgi:cell wall-associated NlpC family hydrolase
MGAAASLVERLHQLPVRIDEPPGLVIARVDRYFSGNKKNSSKTTRHALRAYRQLFETEDRLRDLAIWGISLPQFVHVFLGYGTVEHIAAALRLAFRHRIYSHLPPHSGPGAGYGPIEGIRHVCENYVGVDCCGLMFNYMAALGIHVIPWTRPGGYGDHQHPRRQQLKDIQPGDLAFYGNREHIAVIDSAGEVRGAGHHQSRPVTICESFGRIHTVAGTIRLLGDTPVHHHFPPGRFYLERPGAVSDVHVGPYVRTGDGTEGPREGG